MAELNPGWRRVRFGDVVQLNKDRCGNPLDAGIERYVGLEHIEPDDLRIRRWGLVAEGTTFTNLFRPGQVLFGKRRAYQRKVAVADFEGICSGDIYVFESKDAGVLLPELLPFICQTDSFFDHAVGTSAGSLSPRTNWTQLAHYEFALPPLDEQRRVANILSAMTLLCNNLNDCVSKSKALWRSLANEHYSSGIHGTAKRRCVYHQVLLGDYLLYSSDGPFGSKLKTEHYTERGVRVIRLQNIQSLHFDDSDKAYISEEYFQSDLQRYKVQPGDVLIAGLGDDSIPAGRACLAPEAIGIAINKADCYCIRPRSGLDAEYLVAFLNSPQGLAQATAYAQGTTRYRLNLGNIKRMKIPLPELEVQKELVSQLKAIKSTSAATITRLRMTDRYFRQLLGKFLD